MKSTNATRKIDSTGRILIPSYLRDELGFETGEEYTFYKHIHEGKLYLCLECKNFDLDEEIRKARKLLAEHHLSE